jgi:multidrug efflux system outer membrane protein
MYVRIAFVLGALLSFFAVACSKLGPDYIKPQLDLPSRWQANSGDDGAIGEPNLEILSRWWSEFNDPTLNALIEESLSSNPTLEIAALRVRASRENLLSIAADTKPSLESGVSSSKGTSSGQSSTGKTTTSYSASVDASWEVDLFGKKRRNVEAAVADLKTEIANNSAARASLTAEVGETYSAIRST